MFKWLKSLFGMPEPTGPPETIQTFGPNDRTITRDVVAPEGAGWRIELSEGQTIRLFEVENPDCEQCMLTYRARLRSENLGGKAYLEMWCCFPGQGEFFSKGLNQPLQGTTDWASYETPFILKKGQKPDLVKLNLIIETSGTVWIENVELLRTPLA